MARNIFCEVKWQESTKDGTYSEPIKLENIDLLAIEIFPEKDASGTVEVLFSVSGVNWIPREESKPIKLSKKAVIERFSDVSERQVRLFLNGKGTVHAWINAEGK